MSTSRSPEEIKASILQDEIYLRTVMQDLRDHGFYEVANILEDAAKKAIRIARDHAYAAERGCTPKS